MSAEDVALARAFTDAFNAGDIDGLVACCHEDIEFHSTFAAVGGVVYHRRDGMRRWYRDIQEAWGGAIRSDLEAFFDLGEHLLVLTVIRGTGSRSGVQTEQPVAVVTRSRDGLVVYYRAYLDRQEALRDLDVSEEELGVQIDPNGQ